MKLMKKIDKKYIINSVVTFIVLFLLCMLVHGVLLKPDYNSLASHMRTEADAKGFMGYMVTGFLIMAFALNWLYRQGKTAKPFLGQGVRFGIAVAAVVNIAGSLIFYTVFPWPWETVVKDMVFSSITTVITGIVIAWLNKKA